MSWKTFVLEVIINWKYYDAWMTESLQVHTIVHTITNNQPHYPNHKNTKYRLIQYFANCLISGYLNNANPKNQIFNMESVL